MSMVHRGEGSATCWWWSETNYWLVYANKWGQTTTQDPHYPAHLWSLKLSNIFHFQALMKDNSRLYSPPLEDSWLHEMSLHSFGHDRMCNAIGCSADGWEASHHSESETFGRNLCATMVGCCQLLGAQTPWHQQDFCTCKEHMQLSVLQREVGTAKKDDILWFTTNLMWDPSTCTHPSQWQKTEESALLHLHGILRDTSWFTLLWTDSSLWNCRSCLRHCPKRVGKLRI